MILKAVNSRLLLPNFPDSFCTTLFLSLQVVVTTLLSIKESLHIIFPLPVKLFPPISRFQFDLYFFKKAFPDLSKQLKSFYYRTHSIVKAESASICSPLCPQSIAYMSKCIVLFILHNPPLRYVQLFSPFHRWKTEASRVQVNCSRLYS